MSTWTHLNFTHLWKKKNVTFSDILGIIIIRNKLQSFVNGLDCTWTKFLTQPSAKQSGWGAKALVFWTGWWSAQGHGVKWELDLKWSDSSIACLAFCRIYPFLYLHLLSHICPYLLSLSFVMRKAGGRTYTLKVRYQEYSLPPRKTCLY